MADEGAVHAGAAEFVDNQANFLLGKLLEHVVEEGGLACAQEAGEKNKLAHIFILRGS